MTIHVGDRSKLPRTETRENVNRSWRARMSQATRQFLLLMAVGAMMWLGATRARGTEPVTEAWVARYDSPTSGWDQANAIAVDFTGNVFVTGWSNGGAATQRDFATIKYDGATGMPLWTARYDGPVSGNDEAWAVAVDPTGNVMVTGYSIGNASTRRDFATVKYDGATGTPIWTARYASGEPWAIAVDTEGNVIVTGSAYGGTAHGTYATVKYDGATGSTLWSARYDGPGANDDVANAVVVDYAGDIVITGFSYGGTATRNDYATIKYDGTTGTPIWTARYNGPGSNDDQANAIGVDSAGNVVVTGSAWHGTTDLDYATIKYDGATGTPIWTARYNNLAGFSADAAKAIAVDRDGNAIVTGYSWGGLVNDHDYATIKYDGNTGSPLWTARYNGPGTYEDQASAIAVDGLGNVIVTGTSVDEDVAGTGIDYATISYSGATGAPLWSARYVGPGFGDRDLSSAVAVDDAGSAFVTGYSWGGAATGYDYATIKYVGAVPANGAPVAEAQEVLTSEDTSMAIVLTATDVDRDPLAYSVETAPFHGILVGTTPNLTYTPAANYHGPDSFTFRVNDGTVYSNTATVSINVTPVNDAPEAFDDVVSTAEDVAKSVLLAGTDVDGDPITYAVLNGPAHGTLTGTAPKLTYAPTANYFGPDSFSFRVNDGSLSSSAATVSLTITPVNDTPIADAGADRPIEATGTTTVVMLNGSGSSDPDGDALTYLWSEGAITVATGANPEIHLSLGVHTLKLTATDPTGSTSTDTVVILVRDITAPVLTVPADFTLPRDSARGAMVTYTVTAKDNVPGFTVNCIPASGTVFPLGTTTVSCTATDTSGNVSQRLFAVTVITPASAPGRVTAKGAILLSSRRSTFRLSALVNARGRISGALTFTDPNVQKTVRSTKITAVVFEGASARVFGRCRIGRQPEVEFMVYAEDRGRRAADDRIRLELGSGESWGPAALKSGNVRISR